MKWGESEKLWSEKMWIEHRFELSSNADQCQSRSFVLIFISKFSRKNQKVRQATSHRRCCRLKVLTQNFWVSVWMHTTTALRELLYARLVALENSELPHAARTQMMNLIRFVLSGNVCIQSSVDLNDDDFENRVVNSILWIVIIDILWNGMHKTSGRMLISEDYLSAAEWLW